MSSEVAYVSIEPDYTSYRTVELYKSQNCSGQAFVAGVESGVSEVSIDTDDFGGPIWDDQARSVKISEGLELRLFEGENFSGAQKIISALSNPNECISILTIDNVSSMKIKANDWNSYSPL